MTIGTTDSCACYEIKGLANHRTPQEAMAAFCQQSVGKTLTFRGQYDVAAGRNTFACYYLFSGLAESNSYGPKFAQFIQKNSLGEVWAAPPKDNKAWHSGRLNQIWIWMPDQAAVERWWAGQQAPAKKGSEDGNVDTRRRAQARS